MNPLDSRRARRGLLAATVAVAASLPLMGCVVVPAGHGGVVMAPPPPARIERPGPPPVVGYLWIDGFWGWRGGRHEWVGGHWEAPRPGYRWAPHRWDRDDRGWRERPGRWERG